MNPGGRLAITRSFALARFASDERIASAVLAGDPGAFEALYERHSRELLRFSTHMLGSQQDGEDAVQAAFISAFRAMRANVQPRSLRPWLFKITRNQCIDMLRARKVTVELNGEPALTGDPVRHAETVENVRELVASMALLPEEQRSALVLAEVNGMSHADIAGVLGCNSNQVKAFVYQARTNLSSEREARATACRDVREQLDIGRSLAKLRGPVRRHVRSCPGCSAYAHGVTRRQRQFQLLMPVIPALTLKYRALEEAIGITGTSVGYAGGGGSAALAGAAVDAAGGGLNGLLLKLGAGFAALGAGAGVGVSVLGHAPAKPVHGSHAHGGTLGSSPGGASASLGGGSLVVTGSGRLRLVSKTSPSRTKTGGESPGSSGPNAPGSSTPGSGAPGQRGEGGTTTASHGNGAGPPEQRKTNNPREEAKRERESQQGEHAESVEERQAKHAEELAERKKEREIPASRAPKTEEERLLKREQKARKQQEKEAAEREQAGGETTPSG